MYSLLFDGIFQSISGNDRPEITAGFMGYGWLIFRRGTLVARGHGVFARGKDANSSIAEYLALIEGLEALSDMGIMKESVEVSGDAKGIIDQMIGKASVNSPRIKPLYQRAMKLAGNFEHLYWKWTPRKHNRDADQLTRRAMRQMHIDQANYLAVMEAIQPGNQNERQMRKFLPLMDLRIFQPET